MVRAAQPVETGVRVDERRDLRSRVAEDHTELSGRGSVIVAVGVIRIFNLSTHVAVEEVGDTPDRAVVDGRIGNGAIDTDVGARRNRNRAVRGQVRVTCENVNARSRRLRRSAGFGAVLDESWAKRLAEPSPTAPATSRIRPSEVNGRECMRLSSATTGKSFKTWKSFNKTIEPKGRGSSHNSIRVTQIQTVGCKTSTSGNLQHISYLD